MKVLTYVAMAEGQVLGVRFTRLAAEALMAAAVASGLEAQLEIVIAE